MIKAKLKAASIHLLMSAVVVGCFLAFALTVWYPEPFFSISGLANIILLLVTVDVILGPLLTLVVFKPKKSTLKLDLSVIALIQVAALGYGMHTIYQAHPLYIAYSGDRFTAINANEVDPTTAKYPELRQSTFATPTIVYVEKPSDPAELSRVLMETLSGKPDLDARPEYYQPIGQHAATILAGGIPQEKIRHTPENQQKLSDFLQKHGKTASDYAFIPLIGREDDVLWAWSHVTAKPVGVLAINPWTLH